MVINFSASALLAIDVQNDFCPGYTAPSGEKRPGGALAVAGGGAVIPPLNTLAARFAAEGGRVVATADWHPGGHISFASAHSGKRSGDTVDLPTVKGQALWPDHCIQGSAGAAFHATLDLRPVNLILRKGYRQNLDSYSAFFENDRLTPTGLHGYLQGLGITSLFIGGLATDYCVLYSALDAARLGYTTTVLIDAVRGVGFPAGSVERALSRMGEAGISLLASGDIR
jgi:nicotinamidase/pyrazinamidase